MLLRKQERFEEAEIQQETFDKLNAPNPYH